MSVLSRRSAITVILSKDKDIETNNIAVFLFSSWVTNNDEGINRGTIKLMSYFADALLMFSIMDEDVEHLMTLRTAV